MKRIWSFILCMCLVITTLVVTPASTVEAATVPTNANLLNTYGTQFNYVGNALVASEILNPNILNMAAKEYNSITVGNEMKPDYVLGWSSQTMSVAQAKSMGYYIPDSYRESTVPKLDFTTVDKMLKACYDKGLKMRGHTLVWHSQTPDWFFRAGYSKTTGYVTKDQMYAREEYFIKNYMNHVCTSPYGSVIYAWDVVNEYLHAGNTSGWQKIFGSNLGPRAEFVKRAFEYAYDTLSYFKLTDKVHLFYNDYNTYMEVNDVISLVNYVNSGRKICAGVGMQSHLSTDFPSVAYYKNALSSFCKQGFEVQITELDVGAPNYNVQANYYYDLMKAILDVKKSGGNITALVWWGMTDDTSWRDDKPLLYSTYNVKKPSYNSVLQAYFDAGYKIAGSQPGNPQPSQPATVPGTTVKLNDGWYFIKNVKAQKYLQVAGNAAKAGTNVELRTGSGSDGQKWYLKNVADGYVTLTSALGNFMLDVASGKNEDGTNIGIYDGYSGTAQQFILKTSKTNGAYVVATKTSNNTKVLDDYNHSTTDGANVIQWSYTGSENQQWVFEAAKTVAPTQPTQPSNPQPTEPSIPAGSKDVPSETVSYKDGWYYIKNVNAQKYLTVTGNKGADGQNVELRTGSGADGQKWYLKNAGYGYITLTSSLGSFMLDVTGCKNADGQNIEIYRAHSGAAEQFMLKKSATNGACVIATKASNLTKVVEAYNHGKTDGTNVCQYSYYGNPNQLWVFEAINSQPANPQPTQPSNPQPTVQSGMKLDYTINSWGSGYQVSFKVTNNTSARINTWTLKLKKSEINITASWNVNIKSSGDYYVITPVEWNSTLDKGASTEFGIQGSGTIGTKLGYTFE